MLLTEKWGSHYIMGCGEATLVVSFCYQTEAVTWFVYFKEKGTTQVAWLGMQGNTCAPVTSKRGWKKKTVVSALTRWERERERERGTCRRFFQLFFLLFVVFLIFFSIYFFFGGFNIQVGKQRLVGVCVGMDERKVCHCQWKSWLLSGFCCTLCYCF